MRHRFVILVLVGVLLGGIVSDISSQTIAFKDLSNFEARLAYRKGWLNAFDYSQIVDWRIVSDSVKSAYFFGVPFADSTGGWAVKFGDVKNMGQLPFYYFKPHLKGKPVPAVRHQDLRLQIMVVAIGVGDSHTCLSSWEAVGTDSLRFLGFSSEVSEYYPQRIERVMLFPDSSLLLYVTFTFASMGEYRHKDCFFRSTDGVHFSALYITPKNLPLGVRQYVDAERLQYDQYRIKEVSEYFTSPLRGTRFSMRGYDGSRLDSASIRVIDLWDLAKEKFGIDTTSLPTPR